MKRQGIRLVLLCIITAAMATQAAELELFNARSIEEDQWTWSDARMEKNDYGLLVTEINKTGDYGNVFVDRRLPYHPAGRVDLDVAQIMSGAFTLQALAFVGDTHIHTAELIKGSTRTGPQSFALDRFEFPPETQSVLFKLWAVETEGASLLLNDLRYVLPIEETGILRDEQVDRAEHWEGSDLIVTPVTTGVRATLVEGKAYGNLLFGPMFPRAETSTLLLNVPEMSYGVLTLQLAAFNSSGEFIEAFDVIKRFGAGWHGIPLDRLAWPDTAAQFRIKLWLEGTAGAEAIIDRVLLLKN